TFENVALSAKAPDFRSPFVFFRQIDKEAQIFAMFQSPEAKERQLEILRCPLQTQVIGLAREMFGMVPHYVQLLPIRAFRLQ
ncbi:MAG: hypothetical protein EB078_08335, partial [Proteobacteria bacterium]|nr:hypothetical protein [Pseudomonadota bacterium]